MESKSNIRFIIHGKEHTVSAADVTPATTLLQYIREHEHLKGTKYMCLEGGCGACIVSVTTKHPITKRTTTFAVNSCLVSIYSCEGWKINTVEEIGSKRIGYHPIQKVLAEFNGTQCGFCSPGMVMNMHALYESSSNLTMKNIETAFGGNMCRCTGYRPILTAFKSLAIDAEKKILGEYPDIEDIEKCDTRNCHIPQACFALCKKRSVSPRYSGYFESRWFKVYSINEIFDVLRAYPNNSYQLVAGNTAKGVYPNFNDNPDMHIDIQNVWDLRNDALTLTSLYVGANKTLTDTIGVFRKTASFNGFEYLNLLADHIELVAHVPVRNIGTLAGNLTIKHQRNEFPSDLFLILETIEAQITIVNANRREEQLYLLSYLSYDMRRKVIKNIVLPKLDKTYKFRSYKITQRTQNAHAIVNAGFLLKLDRYGYVQLARIVYGGISPGFVHAAKTERYLVGKNLFDNRTLQNAFKTLHEEILPDNVLPQPSPVFRKNLAISLFYKFVLNIAPDNKISIRNKSGGSTLSRPISHGTQDFQSNKSLYPLTQPISKLEALQQTSGELEYISDIPANFDELHACFVTAKAPANSIIIRIDTSEALKQKGVISFYSSKDIPGKNSFVPLNANYPPGFNPPSAQIVPEELLCSGVVQYYYQPVGIIVAETEELAERAAELISVAYATGKNKPLLTIREILSAGASDRIFEEASKKATRKGQDVKHIVKGTYDTSWQYHYHMETQICRVYPKEDCLEIYPGTQWMDFVQVAVGYVLNIPENKITIKVKRVGGAFGGKITRSAQTACAAALAAYILQKPVTMRMSFSMNMNVVGKRFPTSADYEVGVNDKGEIQYLNNTFYLDYATGGNETIISKSIGIFSSNYRNDSWTVTGNYTKTDNHASVWARAPGHNNVLAMVETIMEHIAMEINISPLDLRLTNMSQDTNREIIKFVDEFRRWSDYDNRKKEIEKFNENNRWMKKGLSLVPMTYLLNYGGTINSLVAIYAGDGTVAVSHAGVEMGQGINTKVSQVCAYILGIPLNMVTVKASNNLVSPNNFATGGSFTSEEACYATLKACETLLARMKSVRDSMTNPTWPQLVKECFNQNIDLVARHMFSANDPPRNYSIYGVCAAEVQVDILTGNHQINRVDLLEDTGNSISPSIDIGQVEGAFLMGLGYWTTERTVYDKNGKLLTNRTWDYKIPGALDIPVDLRVKFPENNPNPTGVLHSKATGEPALCLACSVPIAIRQAVASARVEADPSASKWYPFAGPSDVENTLLNSLNNYNQYKL